MTGLDTSFKQHLDDARSILVDLLAVIERFEIGDDDRKVLDQAIRDLTDLFQIVVLGEFNAGKSALLNALLGDAYLAVGAIPTTQSIQIIRYSDTPYEHFISENVLERGIPQPWLKDLSLVDTPGTNAVFREHERITNEYLPRADLVLFTTSADRPFTETEREFLVHIREWGKKIVILINKIDLLSGADRDTVIEFVRTQARTLLHIDPPVFPISARLANNGEREESGIQTLDDWMRETLSGPEKLRLKLMNPLGVVLRLLSAYLPEAKARLSLLSGDTATLEEIDALAETMTREIRRDAAVRLETVDNVIYGMNQRADAFFDEHVRIGRLPDLIRGDRIKKAFEEDVVKDISAKIDLEVARTVDWLAGREEQLWREVNRLLAERRQIGDNAGGRLADSLGARRKDELRGVSEATSGIVANFDRQAEAEDIARSFQTAIAQTAIAEVGAVSLGAALAVLLGTVAADITGILAAGVLGGLALFILPRRRDNARKEFREKTDQLRERLNAAIREAIDRTLVDQNEHLHTALGPYRRFVQTEQQRVGQLVDKLDDVDSRARRLRAEIVRG